MSIEETPIDTQEPMPVPVNDETNEVIQKPKVKKPRSEAQIKAFAIAREKLTQKRLINKETREKEMAVKVKERELSRRKVEEVNQKFEELIVNEDEEEEPPVKPKAKPKKKAKQKIVVKRTLVVTSKK